MATPPLKRIYFDTNILYRWPNPPNDVNSLLTVAMLLECELILPEVVERELEAQFVRSMKKAYDSAERSLKEINKLCRDVITPDFQISRPDETALRDAFGQRSDELKRMYGLANIPIPPLDVRTLVDMAIHREAPFEAKIVNGDEVITGLQDTAILFSILEDMKTAKPEDRCAIISADGIFHAEATRKLVKTFGCKLEYFRKVSDMFSDFFDHVWEGAKAAWHAENEVLEACLNAQKDALTLKIFAHLESSDVGQSIWARAKEIKEFSITKFFNVWTEIQHPEFRPLGLDSYKRRDGSEVRISARAISRTAAIVEAANWTNLFIPTSMRTEVDMTPKLEDATFTETLNVSLTGTVKDGVIREFQVTSVDIYRP